MDATEEWIQALLSTRPEYDAELEWQRFLLDAYGSTGGFRGRVKQPDSSYWGAAADMYFRRWDNGAEANDSYLDKYPREDAEKFKLRRDVAHYVNYVRKITDIKLSYLSRKPPERELPDAIKAWAEDVNGSGRSFASQRDLIRLRAAICGWCPVLVDAPRAADLKTKAQADALNIKPRTIPLYPSNLLAYTCDENGEFEWAKLRMDYMAQPTWDAPPEHQIKIQIWERTRVVVITLVERDSKMVLVAPPEEIPHAFGRVPLVIFRHQPAGDDDVKGIPMSGDVAIENRRLFNLHSELDEHLRGQVFAFLQIPTKNPASIGDLKFGVYNALPLPMDSARDYAYIAPPASVAATYESRIEATEKAIYHLGRVEYARATTGQAVSGLSRRYEFEATNRAIADFAMNEARGEEQVYEMVAPVLGVKADPGSIRVTAQQRFDVEDMQAEIQQALDAQTLGLGQTAEQRIRMRIVHLLLPNLTNEDLEKIEQEALAAAQERAAQEKAMVDATLTIAEDGGDEDEDEEAPPPKAKGKPKAPPKTKPAPGKKKAA